MPLGFMSSKPNNAILKKMCRSSPRRMPDIVNKLRSLDKHRVLNKRWDLNESLKCKLFVIQASFDSDLTLLHDLKCCPTLYKPDFAYFNHQRNILTAFPKNIPLRIINLSTNECTFNNAKRIYDIALSESGFKSKLEFQQKDQTKDQAKQTPIDEIDSEMSYGSNIYKILNINII